MPARELGSRDPGTRWVSGSLCPEARSDRQNKILSTFGEVEVLRAPPRGLIVGGQLAETVVTAPHLIHNATTRRSTVARQQIGVALRILGQRRRHEFNFERQLVSETSIDRLFPRFAQDLKGKTETPIVRSGS